MDEYTPFRTKKATAVIGVLGILALLALSVYVVVEGVTVPGILLGIIVIIGSFLERHEMYQRVTVSESQIRYKRLLDRERSLRWADVSDIRVQERRLELVGEPKSIRVYLCAGFENTQSLLESLAEHLPHLIKKVPPPSVKELIPPSAQPIVTGPATWYRIVVVALGLPSGLFLVAMGGLMMWLGLSEGEPLILPVMVVPLAIGGLVLIWVLHEASQRVIVDDRGVRLRSWWRGGFLLWAEVEGAATSRWGWDLRLSGSGKSLCFVTRWVRAGDRQALAEALQYYLTLHELSVSRRERLLP